MIRLIVGLFIGFAIIMAYTIYKAESVYDGLVEPGYYEKGRDYFQTRRAEEAMGLVIAPLTLALNRGAQDFSVTASTKNGPLIGARAALTVGQLRSSKTDTTYEALPGKPGVYTAHVNINGPGAWTLRFDLVHPSITSQRVWHIKAD